ncbi:tRNA-guanine transglycosylase family protein [Grosmannia clavigera kw1407]|uniref:tRNA-guanine transglycosylase family protein n=1 Tax=Grosmannia clavigera (strain kw1407 / UAMH 11150) TaxID=655863 RepID=F0XM99_GROCL|nr:tRNA-guanine transglycosylase family protein [Grosmannia clavigera kw1407]EFX01473.1 tRNA-guanine transglycosylase family protein [Grosmannia clavigera kw1407]
MTTSADAPMASAPTPFFRILATAARVVEQVPLQPDRTPPILTTPLDSATSSSTLTSPSRLHAFCALPPAAISVLAPRRHPAAAAHLGNGPGHISVVTSTGFQKLTLDAYHDAVDALLPDIVVPMADLTYGGHGGLSYPTAKRAVRMADRTEDWIDQFLSRTTNTADGPHVFAPTLPVPYATQWQYLNGLADWMTGQGDRSPQKALAGLAVYDVDLLPDLRADYDNSLALLPRLSLHPAPTPHHMLRQIALGADLIVLPAITAASEAGLAYTFSWDVAFQAETMPSDRPLDPLDPLDPPDHPDHSPDQILPLAVDLSDPSHAASLLPLAPGCSCAACVAGHHRAYVHHLLDAHEMLAWTLLQIHNHHVVDRLFAAVRATLADPDPDAFERTRRRFHLAFAPDLPVGSAVRPRARGYQAVSNGPVDSRLNKPAWGRLEEVGH